MAEIRNWILGIVVLVGTFKETNFAFSKQPQIRVTTDPSRVRNGEPVLLKIRIETGFNDAVNDVNFPLDNPNWKMIQTYRDHSTIVKLERGKSASTRVVEFTYTLLPLKKGVIQIPSLPVVVNNKEYKSFATFIQVDKLRDSIAQAPLKSAPSRPLSPKIKPQLDQGYEDQLIEVPELDSYFVRGIPGKTTVYEGEMVPLSYRVFMRKRARLENSTISKFPDFKGFLKEELFIARQYQPTPTSIRGENFLEFELIRYALFPLKSGFLKIEPLRFRSTTFVGLDDLAEDLLYGNPRYSRNGIPMEKSSQEITLNVRPLPPVPSNLSFSGAVGLYSIDLVGPESSVTTETPFSVNLVITGAGNVKSIEEPALMLPEDLELKQTQTRYEFDAQATGTKTFEYILVAKKSGLKKIPPLFWTFFDPLKGKYQTLQTLPLEFTVLQGTSKPLKPGEKPQILTWKTYTPKPNTTPIELDSFDSRRGVSKTLGLIAWPLLGVLYVLLFALYFFQRISAKRNQFLFLNPWVATENRIKKAMRKSNSIEASSLIDLWIRQKMIFALKNHKHLTEESERSSFWIAIQSEYKAENQILIRKLEELFSSLDKIRFANRENPRSDEITKLFADSKLVIEDFEKTFS